VRPSLAVPVPVRALPIIEVGPATAESPGHVRALPPCSSAGCRSHLEYPGPTDASDLARRTGQPVDVFVESLLRRFAEADVRVEGGVPVFPPRPDAPTLTVADVNRLADGE